MSLKTTDENHQWRQTAVLMKRDIYGYLQSKGCSEEDCVIDLLQALYGETLSDATKVMVLGALQELSESLLMDKTGVEQAVGTLIGFFQEVAMSKGSTFLKSQILVCMTTILLTGDQLRDQQSLFLDVTNLLFDIISKVNQGTDRALRETACQCLEEIENNYPGVLMHKLDHFYAMCQLENTHVRQTYVGLFNRVLRNAVRVKCQQASVSKDDISDLLLTRKEPLKPLMLPDAIPPAMFQLQSRSPNERISLPSDVDTSELQAAVMKSMDNLLEMSEPDAVKAIQELSCICNICNLPIQIFQDMQRNLTTSLSLPLFHVHLYLMKHYFSESVEAVNLESVTRHICHPALSLGHRLFCLHFCMDISHQIRLEDEDSALFKPTIFDSLDETLTKLKFVIKLSPDGLTSNALLSYLEPLMTSVKNGAIGKGAVACFRGLFHIYANDQSEDLNSAISDFVVEEAVSQHPHFADHALNFISCVSEELPDSKFPSHLLQSLTNFIAQVSPKKSLENLEHFLKIFNAAAMEESIQLKPVTKYLQDLFKSTNVLENRNWLLGNQMIQICHNLMLHTSLPNLFTSVGEILFSLMTRHSDTNIRDVARFFYSMLIHLSEEKIKAILRSLDASNNGQNLTNLVTGTNNFPVAAPVVHLQEPILQLKRLQRSYKYEQLMDSLHGCSFSEYLRTVSTNASIPEIVIDLQICNGMASESQQLPFSKLYAIVLSVQSPTYYNDIEDLHVPYFALNDEEGCRISLVIIPNEPNPANLEASAMFTSSENKTYTCKLKPLRLEFEDFFLPLPVAADERRQIFNDLWSHLDSEVQRDNSACIQSVTTLPFTASQFHPVINEKLSDYIIARPDGDEDAGWIIGILLPPRWHLLLKMKATDVTVVTINTDNWRLLPLVSHFLKSFTDGD
ncbi:AP-5 complex subunit beta-1-like isoform X2 [Apostichopus japonicus]|uniref:AP-5 complex subunit beta-1-like isoform X2 n=1 Tax=Stichopus japonicus TaxID=307972 RepID=UPI003AB36C28